VPPFHKILRKLAEYFPRNPANKQTNKHRWKHNLLGGGKSKKLKQKPLKKDARSAKAASAPKHVDGRRWRQ